MTMTLIKRLAGKIWRDRSGQDMIEYALMAGFVTISAIAALPHVFYDPLNRIMVTIASKMQSLAS
jgi:Flp pilus assembly pilin Flp